MKFTYPKHEKLKSKTTIDLLFSEGKSISKYPLCLVYVENTEPNAELIKMGVSVSKKYFKKAVDRNYFKRVLRETYRLNKHLLIDNLEKYSDFCNLLVGLVEQYILLHFIGLHNGQTCQRIIGNELL